MFRKRTKKHLNLAEIYHEGEEKIEEMIEKTEDVFEEVKEKSEELINEIPVVKKRQRKKLFHKTIKYLGYGLIGLILMVVIFLVINFSSFKTIYSQAMSGKDNAIKAASFAKQYDFEKARTFSTLSKENFNKAYLENEEIKSGFIISHISYFENQFNDISYLLKTAEILTKTLEEGTVIGEEFFEIIKNDRDFNFQDFTTEQKKSILQLIYESGPELNGLKANLDLAILNLQQVRGCGLLWPLQGKIRELENQLEQVDYFMSEAIPATQLLPVLTGYPDKSTFLVMLQNSDEIRPTGGFLGTYGILDMQNADIIRFDTHDIYHMDMPVQDFLNITPPEPIEKYLNPKWYLRDSNWSPDWPTAAQKIEWFFELEDKLLPTKDQINNLDGEFAGVIGITPEFIKDLLEIVGPITIEGQVYDSENFTQLLEYRVEQSYYDLGVPSWHRKEVIGDISRELKIRLLNLPISSWGDLLGIIDSNIYKKNILVYLHDEQSQDVVSALGWSGEVKQVDSDYLMVVDSNMAALKTDAVMGKSVEYEIEENSNGLFAKLKINYAHYGGYDWRTSEYKTYTRIFVPKGSELIKSSGVSSGEFEVGIDVDLDKTYFGGFIRVDSGEVGSLYLEYKLPEYIEEQVELGSYDLFVQKQAGNSLEKLTVDLKLQNEIKSYSPTGFFVNTKDSNEIEWETKLEGDRRFIVNFD